MPMIFTALIGWLLIFAGSIFTGLIFDVPEHAIEATILIITGMLILAGRDVALYLKTKDAETDDSGYEEPPKPWECR